MKQIYLNKRNEVWENNWMVFAGTINEVVNYLKSVDQSIISVQWRVVENAPVSVEKQNKTYLRRIKKIAQLTGRQVVCFDKINDVKFGCALTW